MAYARALPPWMGVAASSTAPAPASSDPLLASRRDGSAWTPDADTYLWSKLGHFPRTPAGNLKGGVHVRQLVSALAAHFGRTEGAIKSRLKLMDVRAGTRPPPPTPPPHPHQAQYASSSSSSSSSSAAPLQSLSVPGPPAVRRYCSAEQSQNLPASSHTKWTAEADRNLWQTIGHFPRTPGGYLPSNALTRQLVTALAAKEGRTEGAIKSRLQHLDGTARVKAPLLQPPLPLPQHVPPPQYHHYPVPPGPAYQPLYNTHAPPPVASSSVPPTKRVKQEHVARQEAREARFGQMAAAPAQQAMSMDDQASAPLVASLKVHRLALAHAKNLPAYCIFDNKTLDAIVASCPTTLAALLLVKGMGTVKVASYGPGIIDILIRHKYSSNSN